MANKRSGGTNQPRRKKNKKPVKRYSEEYSNRPNPYTGYSADGNYHPEAKKHTHEDASVAEPDMMAAALAEVEQQSVAEDMAEKTEMVSAEIYETSEDNNETTVKSRRKKNIDREAEKKAQDEKRKARRTAVEQISQGVVAHTVSEQMIDDIASFSDIVSGMDRTAEEDLNKDCVDADTAALDDEEIQSQEPEKAAQPEEQAETPEFDAFTVVDDSDPLPFDVIKAEKFKAAAERISSDIEAEVGTEDAQNDTSEVTETADNGEPQTPENGFFAPLRPEDLIPVLDFDKLADPFLDFSQPVNSDEAVAPSYDDIADTVSIEDILKRVEAENIDSSADEFVSESREFDIMQDVVFDTMQSEQWDGAVIPPFDINDQSCTETVVDDTVDPLADLTAFCFDDMDADTAAFETEHDTDLSEEEQLADDEQFAGDEQTSVAEVNDDISDEVDASEGDVPEVAAADENDGQEDDISESLESLFTAPDIDSLGFDDDAEGQTENSDFESVDMLSDTESGDEPVDESEEAAQSKLRRLIEAAELAEILRGESHEVGDDDDEDYEHPIVNFIAESMASEEAEDDTETVKCYVPSKSAKPNISSDDIFESILIVDEGTSLEETSDEEQDESLFKRTPTVEENPTAVFRLPENSASLYADFEYDDADFREKWLDEELTEDEQTSHQKKMRRRISAFVGALVFCFAIIAVSVVIKEAATGLNNIGGVGEKKSEYTDFIKPVVINDPMPFDSVENADNQTLLESAIWRVLDELEESSEYKNDATGKIVLPAKNVLDAGKSLFGNDVDINLNVMSESDGNVLYYYDSIDDTFHISPGSIQGPSAEIKKIAQTENSISLKVGYYSSSEPSSTSSGDDAYKYMEYVLAVDEDGSYHIDSIRDYKEN